MPRSLRFVLELISGSPIASTRRIAALNHEIGNNAMENRVVVEAIRALLASVGMRPLALPFRELNEILHRFGRVALEKHARKGSFRGVKYGISARLARHKCPFSDLDSRSCKRAVYFDLLMDFE